jgi:hypothetical protein
MTHASALGHNRFDLTDDEATYVREAVDHLLAEFERHDIPLRPAEKPRERDTVGLLKPYPAHDLGAGSTGIVVVGYEAAIDGGVVGEYEVRFIDPGGAEGVLVNLSGGHIEVVRRPGHGRPSS